MSTEDDFNGGNDLLGLVERHEELFERIATEAEDPRVAARYGENPLRLLELEGKRGDQA